MEISKEIIDKIEFMYQTQKLSAKDISVDMNISIHKVYYYMRKHNIERRNFSKSQTKKVRDKIKKTNIKKYGVACPLQNDNVKAKRKRTNIKKYGVENSSQNEEIKEKIKNTNLKRYGVEHFFNSKVFKDKSKKTNLKRYGTEQVFQNEDVKNKIKKTNLKKYEVENPSKNKSIYEKIKKTNLQKYGVESPSQNKNIRNKIKKTNIERYGVESPLQNEEIKRKFVKTCLDRYGFKNPVQNKIIRDKIKKTMNDRYGCDYPYQNKDIYEKSVKNSFKYKKYTMPSGIEVYIQGYEGVMLDILLKKYNEIDIQVHSGVPTIKWTTKNGKHKIHYPDIYIKSINKLIEVKSIWTFNKEKENIFEKKEQAEKQGYLYGIFVLKKYNRKDNTGEIIHEI